MGDPEPRVDHGSKEPAQGIRVIGLGEGDVHQAGFPCRGQHDFLIGEPQVEPPGLVALRKFTSPGRELRGHSGVTLCAQTLRTPVPKRCPVLFYLSGSALCKDTELAG